MLPKEAISNNLLVSGATVTPAIPTSTQPFTVVFLQISQENTASNTDFECKEPTQSPVLILRNYARDTAPMELNYVFPTGSYCYIKKTGADTSQVSYSYVNYDRRANATTTETVADVVQRTTSTVPIFSYGDVVNSVYLAMILMAVTYSLILFAIKGIKIRQ